MPLYLCHQKSCVFFVPRNHRYGHVTQVLRCSVWRLSKSHSFQRHTIFSCTHKKNANSRKFFLLSRFIFKFFSVGVFHEEKSPRPSPSLLPANSSHRLKNTVVPFQITSTSTVKVKQTFFPFKHASPGPILFI